MELRNIYTRHWRVGLERPVSILLEPEANYVVVDVVCSRNNGRIGRDYLVGREQLKLRYSQLFILTRVFRLQELYLCRGSVRAWRQKGGYDVAN